MKKILSSVLAPMLLAMTACTVDTTDPAEDPLAPDYEPTDEISQPVTCNARISVYPVRGRHNNGYDRTAGNSSQWTCDNANSNSDFVAGDHLGNDIWAPEGTPVAAPTDGTLTLTGWSNYSGNKVTIKDGCGWYHFMCHLQRIAPGMTNGRRVRAGEIVGYVGKTGTASNGVVHLHYSTYPDGNYNRGIDPYPLLRSVERNTCSGGGGGGSGDASCGVRADKKLYCKNTPGAPMRASARNGATIVNRLRTTTSWFTCWGTGDRHAGNNTTWYYTQGDDNARWGWVAGIDMGTTSAFDANPSAHGLKKCDD